MENSNRTHLQQDQSSSRFTKNITFLISSIIIFTFIIGAILSVSFMLKLELESQSLSSNPSQAIQDVCHVMHYFPLDFSFSGTFIQEQELNSRFDRQKLCLDSISPLFSQTNKNKINPSMIFHLSLQVSMTQIKNLQNELALKETCMKMLNDSKSQLNRSLTLMGIDQSGQSDLVLRDEKLVNDMRLWIKNGLINLEKCLVEVKEKKIRRIVSVDEVVFKINMAKVYLGNCLGILDNLEKILEMFYPSITSELSIDYFHWNLSITRKWGTLFTIVLFCSQYLMLIIIVGVFLHVWRRN